jgi:hypothetical protein
MNQTKQVIQEKRQPLKRQSTYSRAQIIATSRNFHRSSVNHMWLVESEGKEGKFYCVHYLEGELMCDCPAYVYGMTNPCKHILAVCQWEVA